MVLALVMLNDSEGDQHAETQLEGPSAVQATELTFPRVPGLDIHPRH